MSTISLEVILIHFQKMFLKSLTQDENIVILQGDKDSSVAIMDKSDCIHKLEDMI